MESTSTETTVCRDCGASVADKRQHQAWHDKLLPDLINKMIGDYRL